MLFIPKAKAPSNEKKATAGKLEDKSRHFHTTKVRAVYRCVSCGASRVVYSQHMVNSKDGPTSNDMEDLEQRLERDGYTCGMDIKGGKLYCRRAVLCGHPI